MESHRLKAVVEDVRALKGKLEKVLSSDMRTLKTANLHLPIIYNNSNILRV